MQQLLPRFLKSHKNFHKVICGTWKQSGNMYFLYSENITEVTGNTRLKGLNKKTLRCEDLIKQTHLLGVALYIKLLTCYSIGLNSHHQITRILQKDFYNILDIICQHCTVKHTFTSWFLCKFVIISIVT